MTTKLPTFDELLLRAIDEALKSLGKSVMEAIYFYIKDQFSVTKNEIPRKLQQFQEGLKRIFGAGVQFIENLIMKNLATEFRCPPIRGKSEQIEFIEYVDAVKQSYLGDSSKKTFENEEDSISFWPVFTVSVSKP